MFKRKYFCGILTIIVLIIYIFTGVGVKQVYSNNILVGCPTFVKKIVKYFNNYVGEQQTNYVLPQVEISGKPIGFSISCDGVIVVSYGEVLTTDGYKSPPIVNDGIKIGDTIKFINGVKITSGNQLLQVVEEQTQIKQNLQLQVKRNNQMFIINTKAVYDELSNSYKLGLWIRDYQVGIGTVSYLTDDGKFSALGHPVTDVDSGTIIDVGSGQAYSCSILDVKKAKRGEPGELKGLFLKSNGEVGDILENNTDGIKGQFNNEDINDFKFGKKVSVATADMVKPGLAKIVTTIDGKTTKEYEIEIIRARYVNNDGEDCMVIKITDKELLEFAGGIVQGMSGSPIIQNDMLVGVVTHVFVNDPTRGFAEFVKI